MPPPFGLEPDTPWSSLPAPDTDGSLVSPKANIASVSAAIFPVCPTFTAGGGSSPDRRSDHDTKVSRFPSRTKRNLSPIACGLRGYRGVFQRRRSSSQKAPTSTPASANPASKPMTGSPHSPTTIAPVSGRIAKRIPADRGFCLDAMPGRMPGEARYGQEAVDPVLARSRKVRPLGQTAWFLPLFPISPWSQTQPT